MAESVGKMALLLTGETDPSLEAMTSSAIQNLNLVGQSADKANASMADLKRAFHATLSPVSEADALFENHIATQVMLQQNATRLSQILDTEAEQLLNVGQSAQKSADGLGKVQTVAQQGVFAIDDFLAGFQTGGVAGGIRGAANNLSFLAMQLGNIKVALGAIGVLAAAQLAVKWWDESERKRIELARKAIDEYRDSIQQTRDAIASSGASMLEVRDVKKSSDKESLRERFDELQVIGEAEFNRSGELLNLRNQLDSEFANLKFNSNRTDEETMRMEALYEEIRTTDRLIESLDGERKARADVAAAIVQQISDIEAAEAARQRSVDAEFEFEQFVSESDRAVMRNKMDEIAEIDATIAEIQNRNRMGLSEAFGKFASANMMNSVGAVSTLNTAQYGPQNARDAGVTVEQQQLRELRRLRELEERKKSLEVVPL